MNSVVNDLIITLLPTKNDIKKIFNKSRTEIGLLVQHEKNIKMMKVFNIAEIKEKTLLEFSENSLLITNCCSSFTYPCMMIPMNLHGKYMIILREHYVKDMEEIIQNETLLSSNICLIICKICNMLIILKEYDLAVNSIKSSNIAIDESGNFRICDLFLDEMRKQYEKTVNDINFKSPEELKGLECNGKSIIWSVGCVLFEMINKSKPFTVANSVIKTLNNILNSKYRFEISGDYSIKEIIKRILIVKNEDRMSLMELSKEMIKMNKLLRDRENNLMICKERKITLFNGDNNITFLRIVYPSQYYLVSDRYTVIRDNLLESYNNKPNERMLAIMLLMKLRKKDAFPLNLKITFQIHHRCNLVKGCYLDEMFLNLHNDSFNAEIIEINTNCMCMCEEGIKYFFRVFKFVYSTKLKFFLNVPIERQKLFGSYFNLLSDVRQLDLSNGGFLPHFIESFVKCIPFMRLEYVDLSYNAIGSIGLKLLLPYLRLLIGSDNELNLNGMNLNDESIILLAEELYKYPNIRKIGIADKNNIHYNGLRALFYKYPISRVDFNFNGSKELLLDRGIPDLIKYVITSGFHNLLDLNNLGIDDQFFASFVTLRPRGLRTINHLDLSNNNLTHESIAVLIRSLHLFQTLEIIELNGNEIGDLGMKMLSPYVSLLKGGNNSRTFCIDNMLNVIMNSTTINCSKMGLSSIGLKYLVDGLRNIQWNISLDISDNNIRADGIEYLMEYMKVNDNVENLFIHNNPIGNAGFKALLYNLCRLKDEDNVMDLSNISINDECVIILANLIPSIGYCNRINLKGNNVSINGLKAICSRTLEEEDYPLIFMKSLLWGDEELKYYLEYCAIKKNDYFGKCYDFANLNVNDSHMSLIKQLKCGIIDISNTKISCKGLKELTDSLEYYIRYILIYNNNIGDEGIEMICKNLDKFVEKEWGDSYIALNLSNVGMSDKGLKILIDGLKMFSRPLKVINISRNMLNETGLRLMIENKELFENLDKLSISLKRSIDRSELKSFVKTFPSIGRIEITAM